MTHYRPTDEPVDLTEKEKQENTRQNKGDMQSWPARLLGLSNSWIRQQYTLSPVDTKFITSLSISLRGYLTVGSCSVTWVFFFLSPNRNILAKTAVTATTAVPTATGIPWNHEEKIYYISIKFPIIGLDNALKTETDIQHVVIIIHAPVYVILEIRPLTSYFTFEVKKLKQVNIFLFIFKKV